MTMDARRTPSKTREEIVTTLFDLFRRAGYDAVSMADISEATGLGKSSLYHHFPGGKPDMAEAVADLALGFMRENVFASLAGDEPLARKIDRMLRVVDEMYEGGGAPCLIASLMISPTASPKAVKTVRSVVTEWIDALGEALRKAGAKPADARRRATAAIIAFQGALVVARATNDATVFRNALKAARSELVAVR